MKLSTDRAPAAFFFTAKPMLSQCHLQSSGLLWVVTEWRVHQTSLTTGQLPGSSKLEPALAGITQRTKFPKAIKECEGENDSDKRQLEKDGREVRQIKFKSMALPPRIVDSKSTDVISPVIFALDVLPVTLGCSASRAKWIKWPSFAKSALLERPLTSVMTAATLSKNQRPCRFRNRSGRSTKAYSTIESSNWAMWVSAGCHCFWSSAQLVATKLWRTCDLSGWKNIRWKPPEPGLSASTAASDAARKRRYSRRSTGNSRFGWKRITASITSKQASISGVMAVVVSSCLALMAMRPP